MSNRLYDTLKFLALVILPAAGSLYFALSGIWGFPYGEQIVGTITAVDTFLGVALHISTKNYTAGPIGELIIDKTGLKEVYRFDLGENLDLIDRQDTVILKVVHKST